MATLHEIIRLASVNTKHTFPRDVNGLVRAQQSPSSGQDEFNRSGFKWVTRQSRNTTSAVGSNSECMVESSQSGLSFAWTGRHRAELRTAGSGWPKPDWARTYTSLPGSVAPKALFFVPPPPPPWISMRLNKSGFSPPFSFHSLSFSFNSLAVLFGHHMKTPRVASTTLLIKV